MKIRNCLLCVIVCCAASALSAQGQDLSVVFVGKVKSDGEVPNFYERLNKPLLISEDNVYAIGSDCTTYSLMDGTYTQRAKGGKTTRRKRGGQNDERYSGGQVDLRLAGGNVGSRKKNGRNNSRNKGGDLNRRDKGGNTDDRNAGGTLSNAPRCEVADNGRLVLYVRQEIKSKEARIFYKNQFFNSKYFKIKKL